MRLYARRLGAQAPVLPLPVPGCACTSLCARFVRSSGIVFGVVYFPVAGDLAVGVVVLSDPALRLAEADDVLRGFDVGLAALPRPVVVIGEAT